MPRPKIKKMVCDGPKFNKFSPEKSGIKRNIIKMNVEEYEVIRLIDYENLTQEECALQMQVSRPTVQLLYSEARKKIASMLVNGDEIAITGGNYCLCENPDCDCGKKACRCKKPN